MLPVSSGTAPKGVHEAYRFFIYEGEGMEFTEEEKTELVKIDEAVGKLVELGWRTVNYEVSERVFKKSGNNTISLELMLRNGCPLLDG